MTPRDLLAEEIGIFLPELHGTEIEAQALLDMAARLWSQGWLANTRFRNGDPVEMGFNPYLEPTLAYEVPD